MAAHNPGDNLLMGRIRIALESAGGPLAIAHIAARARYTRERTFFGLAYLRDAGEVAEVESGMWDLAKRAR
jgi:hypothetical protein